MYVVLAGVEQGTSYVWTRCAAAETFEQAVALRATLAKEFKVAHIYRRNYIDENGFPPFVVGPTPPVAASLN